MLDAVNGALNIGGALANFGFGLANQIQGQKNFNKQFAYQDDYNKNAIQWRVADARKAGLHPLAALGSNGAGVGSFASSGQAPYIDRINLTKQNELLQAQIDNIKADTKQKLATGLPGQVTSVKQPADLVSPLKPETLSKLTSHEVLGGNPREVKVRPDNQVGFDENPGLALENIRSHHMDREDTFDMVDKLNSKLTPQEIKDGFRYLPYYTPTGTVFRKVRGREKEKYDDSSVFEDIVRFYVGRR